MTKKQFNKEVQEDINRLIENAKPKMTMLEFLNKHAQGENTILSYWYQDDELEGLTDYEILLKCYFLIYNKAHILDKIFKEKYDEFEDDTDAVTNYLKLNKEEFKNKVWKE